MKKMGSGVTKHDWENRRYSGNITIEGKLTSSDNKNCAGSGEAVAESNAVGSYDTAECNKDYSSDGVTDYYHISKLLPHQILGAGIKITKIELYVSDITAPDKIDSIKLRHVDVTSGTITTDWSNTDDKSPDEGTIDYPDVDITIGDEKVYFLEIALDAGTNNFTIRGFGLIYDLV